LVITEEEEAEFDSTAKICLSKNIL